MIFTFSVAYKNVDCNAFVTKLHKIMLIKWNNPVDFHLKMRYDKKGYKSL